MYAIIKLHHNLFLRLIGCSGIVVPFIFLLSGIVMQTIEWCIHMRVPLTVGTLFFEVKSMFYRDYLEPFYRTGRMFRESVLFWKENGES